jgi:transposase-like protein
VAHDEVFIRIRGKQHYLWRAVDQDRNVLDILVQNRRSATAAKRFFRKLLNPSAATNRAVTAIRKAVTLLINNASGSGRVHAAGSWTRRQCQAP